MNVRCANIWTEAVEVLAVVVLGILFCAHSAEATCTDYSGDPSGFSVATAGMGAGLIGFDDGSVGTGDLISTQYAASHNAVFSTTTCEGIYVKTSAYGPPAYSPPFCAEVYRDQAVADEIHSSFTIGFPVPVWGVSLYVLDVNTGKHVDFQVFDDASGELASYDVHRQGDYTHLAVLSDSKNVGSIVVTCDLLGDGIGFDDVTVVPEPATLSLLALGGLALIRRRSLRV